MKRDGRLLRRPASLAHPRGCQVVEGKYGYTAAGGDHLETRSSFAKLRPSHLLSEPPASHLDPDAYYGI